MSNSLQQESTDLEFMVMLPGISSFPKEMMISETQNNHDLTKWAGHMTGIASSAVSWMPIPTSTSKQADEVPKITHPDIQFYRFQICLSSIKTI